MFSNSLVIIDRTDHSCIILDMGRINYSSDENGIEVQISYGVLFHNVYKSKNALKGLLIIILNIIFLLIAIYFFGSISSGFMLICVICFFCWLKFSRTIISIKSGSLTIRETIFGISFNDRHFETGKMSNIRIRSDFFANRKLAGEDKVRGVFVFSYEGKLHCFRRDLDGNEATEILNKLKYYLPSTAFLKS